MSGEARRKRKSLFFSEVLNFSEKNGLICMTAVMNGREVECFFTPQLRTLAHAMEEQKLSLNVLKLVPRNKH